jgi:hypothetical protein
MGSSDAYYRSLHISSLELYRIIEYLVKNKIIREENGGYYLN